MGEAAFSHPCMSLERLEDHPFAAMFPLLSDVELKQLTESIKARGLGQPIVLFEGKILDGRNRYRACLNASIAPTTKEFKGGVLDAIESVWDWNFKRRHLNSSQAACADAERNKLVETYSGIRTEALERMHAGRRLGGETAGRGRPKEDSSPQQIAESKVPLETRAARAKLAGTNPTYINVADKLLTERPDKFEEVKSGEKTLTQVSREIRREELASRAVEPLAGKYRVIYADPPWKYGDTLAISKDGTGESYGPAEAHYPPMSISELCALSVADIAEDNAVLFFWVTSPLLEECFAVIKAWGFKYKTSFVWDKIKHNMGHYNSVRHEFLLVCTRGSCLPDVNKLFDSVQSVERSANHSEKPQEFRTIIDEIYPGGSRIELFARARHDNWKQWGNEAP